MMSLNVNNDVPKDVDVNWRKCREKCHMAGHILTFHQLLGKDIEGHIKFADDTKPCNQKS